MGLFENAGQKNNVFPFPLSALDPVMINKAI